MADQSTSGEQCTCGHPRGLHDGGTGYCIGWANDDCRCWSFTPAAPPAPPTVADSPTSGMCVCGHGADDHDDEGCVRLCACRTPDHPGPCGRCPCARPAAPSPVDTEEPDPATLDVRAGDPYWGIYCKTGEHGKCAQAGLCECPHHTKPVDTEEQGQQADDLTTPGPWREHAAALLSDEQVRYRDPVEAVARALADAYAAALSSPLAPVPDSAARDAETLAQRFHETYERLAPSFGYETRRDSAVPWDAVPDRNRALMTAVCAELLSVLRGGE